MFRLLLLLFGAGLLQFGHAHAFQFSVQQNQEYLIRHYEVEDGLPVNSVNGIVQDDDGYLYFSTYDGLVRFDGYEFHTYNSSNTQGIESNAIQGILKTSNNVLWMVTVNGSLIRKAGTEFSTFGEPELPHRVLRIVETKQQEVWIATESGIASFDDSKAQFTFSKDSLLNTETAVLAAPTDGKVLAVNKYGLILHQQDTSKVLLTSSRFPIPFDKVVQVKQFADDKIWLMGEGGAFRFNLNTSKIDFSYTPQSSDITFWNLEQSQNKMLIFTGIDGFYVYDNTSNSIQKENKVDLFTPQLRFNLLFEGNDGEEIRLGDDELLIDDQIVLETPGIVSGYLDREGSVWVATRSNGVYQIRKSRFANLTDQDIGGLQNLYPVIQGHKGSVLAGSYVNGIFEIREDGISNWTRQNSALANNVGRFLFHDSDGTIYAGLNNEGLWKFNQNSGWTSLPKYEKVNPSQPTVEAMYRTGDELIIGSLGPLVTMQDDAFRLYDETNPSFLNGIRVIRKNGRGSLFLGSYNHGIVRVSGNTYLRYDMESAELSSNSVRDIYIQNTDTLWIATQNVGLNRLILDENGDHRSTDVITTKDGLINNSLHRIIPDDFGYLWISSNGGIMRISEQFLNAYADGRISTLPLLTFNENDGLVNREYNGGVQTAGLKTDDGRIWFPNQQGITIVDPADFLLNDRMVSPKPVIESVTLSDTTIFLDEENRLELPDNNRNLRIKFSAPNFVYNDRVKFSYRMEGVNEQWQPASQSREATLTTISPGEHLFTVQTYMVGSEPRQASVMIVIPPYFYETGWFKILLVFAGLVIIALISQLRLRRLQQREKQLQKRVDEQTQELKKAAEEKSRFFTGITHELKTPLSLIVGPLDDITEQDGPVSPKKFQNRLELMKRNSHRLQHLVDQILDVSKLNADAIRLTVQPVNLPELTRQIAGQFHSKLEQENLSLSISADDFSEHIYVDAEAWERILINLLSNAIRFSPNGGTISLSIQEQATETLIAVKDEGPGIAAEDQQKVFDYLYQAEGSKAAEGTGIGLYLVKGLMEEMGGTITLNSEKGKGAKFVLSLQKGHSHFAPVHTVHHEPLVADRELKSLPVSNEEDIQHDSEPIFDEQILVVEDNRDFRNYLVSVLEEKYPVISAANGEKALEVLKENSPDLVISDVMMPEMDGLEFLNSLRKKTQFKQLPVIFLSAKNREVDIETGLSTGADIYLTKPIRSSLLLTQVEAVLRRERVLQSDTDSPAKTSEPEFKRKVKEIVYRQLANKSLTTNMLADALYISRAKLYYEWKKVSEISINDFIKKLRLEEGKTLIEERGFSVKEAALAVGFSDAGYFSTSFKNEFGVSPSKIKP